MPMDEPVLLGQPMCVKDAQSRNPLALAFVGDTVWDLLVRQRLLLTTARVHSLHRQAVDHVNAGAQARALGRIEALLTQPEADVVRRGRNAHCKHVVPKNQDPVDYRHATGLEALVGYLYLTGQHQRICELFEAAHSESEDTPDA